MSDDRINITSLVGYQTGQPLVQLDWGDKKAQLTSAEARAHAYRILEAADAAESDLFLWQFAAETIGVTAHGAAKLLKEFRLFRDKRRGDPWPQDDDHT